MYRLSRLMLVMAVGLFIYAIAVIGLFAGPLGWIVLAALGIGTLKKRGRALSAFGTAQMAGEEELRRAGMVGAKNGLILGRLASMPGFNFLARVRALLSNWTPAKDACEQFIAPAKRKGGGEVVRLPQACHTMVVAPTGVGKGVSCVIPFLLTCEESCVVVDFKGELASITAETRHRMGHEIVILDPFKVVTS